MRVILNGLPVVGESLFVSLVDFSKFDLKDHFCAWYRLRLGSNGFEELLLDNTGLQLLVEPGHAGYMILARIEVPGGRTFDTISWPVMTRATSSRITSLGNELTRQQMLDEQQLISRWHDIQLVESGRDTYSAIELGRREAMKALQKATKLHSKAESAKVKASEYLKDGKLKLEDAKRKLALADALTIQARERLGLPNQESKLRLQIAKLQTEKNNLKRGIDQMSQTLESANARARTIVEQGKLAANQFIVGAQRQAAKEKAALESARSEFAENTDLRAKLNEVRTLKLQLRDQQEELRLKLELLLEAKGLKVDLSNLVVDQIFGLIRTTIEQEKHAKRAAERAKKAAEGKAERCPSGTCAVSSCGC